MRLLALLAFVLRSAAAALGSVPRHPHLANSNWPIAHGDGFASDSSLLSSAQGPYREEQSAKLVGQLLEVPTVPFLELTANPVTIMFGNQGKTMWTTTVSRVICLEVEENALKIVDDYRHPIDMGYHGAYSFINEDDVYFSSTLSGFGMYKLDSARRIQKVGEFELRDIRDKEAVVGVLMTWSGEVVMATSLGRVVILEKTATAPGNTAARHYTVIASRELTGGGSQEFISNSFALDHHGGIYVVSSTHQHKLQWRPEAASLEIVWETRYSQGHEPLWPGRLGQGSGSTPSVQVDTSQEDAPPKFVVITDGQNPMNILNLDASTGAVLGNKTVTFGAAGSDAQSEQSITVLQNRAVVVNNWMERSEMPWACRLWNMLPQSSKSKAQKACYFSFATLASPGVEQFRMDPNGQLHTTWSRSDVQCSSCIPAAGLGEAGSGKHVFYCVGQRVHDHNVPLATTDPLGWLLAQFKPKTIFTLEALDWETGTSIFSLPLGSGGSWNPMYAAVQVGAQGDVLYGSEWGIVRVAEQQLGAVPAAERLGGLANLSYDINRAATRGTVFGLTIAAMFAIGVVVCMTCCLCCRTGACGGATKTLKAD